ncbi:MAG: glycosyltransferase family 1 protein [Enterovirga sp.]|nr:glycosyltransferase family 1 protein [Enterovirga sp.]
MPARIAFIAGDPNLPERLPPLLAAARALGLECHVLTDMREARGLVERAGGRLVPVAASLRSINPAKAGYASGQVAAALKAVRPDLVHAVGLGPSLIGGAACAMARVECRLYSLGPLGALALPDDRMASIGRRVVASLLKGPLRTASTRFIVETDADRALLGLEGGEPGEVAVLPGAGVDPERTRPLPMRALPPLRIAIAAPMVWREGIDVAVEAVRLAREAGADLDLSLFDQDGSRLRRLGRGVLEDWSRQPGIRLHPAGEDGTAEIWHDHHVACLPSRGGAGVPAFLLEAAASARPLVTTDVPGCRELVSDGTEGFLVPPDDPAALAAAFAKLAADPVLLPRMGAAARARALHGYLERDLIEAVKRLYSGLLGKAAGP